MQNSVTVKSRLFQNFNHSLHWDFFMQEKEEETTKEWKKYTVKPPRDLRSKFELKMEKRKQDEEAAEAAKRRKEEEEKQAVSHCP